MCCGQDSQLSPEKKSVRKLKKLKRIFHLLPWLKELTKESVAHRTKTKLEGSNKQDESDHNEDVVGEEVIDVGIAKD